MTTFIMRGFAVDALTGTTYYENNVSFTFKTNDLDTSFDYGVVTTGSGLDGVTLNNFTPYNIQLNSSATVATLQFGDFNANVSIGTVTWNAGANSAVVMQTYVNNVFFTIAISGDALPAFADAAAFDAWWNSATISGAPASGPSAPGSTISLSGFQSLSATTELDAIWGDGSANTIRSGADGDYLHGMGGDDKLFGENGGDRIWGERGDDKLFGAKGFDRLFGGQGNDTLFGGNGNDTLWGGLGDDKLVGGARRDRMDGGQGNDTLIDGAGNDTMIGGGGADTFVFDGSATHGDDVITDFTPGTDVLHYNGGLWSGDLTFTDTSGGVVITDPGGSVYLIGVFTADLNASDIVLL